MKLLIVFDDMTADMLENQPIVLELLSEAKKNEQFSCFRLNLRLKNLQLMICHN